MNTYKNIIIKNEANIQKTIDVLLNYNDSTGYCLTTEHVKALGNVADNDIERYLVRRTKEYPAMGNITDKQIVKRLQAIASGSTNVVSKPKQTGKEFAEALRYHVLATKAIQEVKGFTPTPFFDKMMRKVYSLLGGMIDSEGYDNSECIDLFDMDVTYDDDKATYTIVIGGKQCL